VALSGLAFAVTFIVVTPQMKILNTAFGDLMQGAGRDQFPGQVSPESIGKLILLFISATVMGTLAEGLVVQAAGDLYLGRRAGFRDSLQKFLPKIPKLVLTRLLALVVYGIIAAAGLAASAAALYLLGTYLVDTGATIPQAEVISVLAVLMLVLLPVLGLILWLFLCWVLLPEVVVLEGRGYISALLRSARIIRLRDPRTRPSRHMTRAAILFLALTAIYGSVHSVLVTLLYGVGFLYSSGSGGWQSVVLGPTYLPSYLSVPFVLLINGCDAVLQPLVWLAMLALYFDIRVRHEGYDLERIADRLADAGAEPAS
ncbi:MAG: hypothetical protein GWP05_08315, partial [Anaerolineaceae bacterium]|nr:hypothetical protein [Anaerolineaceae bacterium]